MTALAALPASNEVRVYGRGKARAVRLLWNERCCLAEVCGALHVTPEFVSRALRWKGHVRVVEPVERAA